MREPTNKPPVFNGDLANLPTALRLLTERPRWVVWRWTWKQNKKTGPKWTKPPFRCDTVSKNAMNNNPETWSPYSRALAAFQSGKVDGIGYNLLDDTIAAFDLDH